MSELVVDPLAGHEKYRTIRPLGQGGMGEIYEAEHRGLGTRVVVKLLKAELAVGPRSVDRMRLEAQSLARLRHPNLVLVTDFDTTRSGLPFFVMELLVGRSLREEAEARPGPFAVDEALALVRQALAGLAAAHGTGLVHRDVKPDNLFVCDAPPLGGGRAVDELGPLRGRSVKLLDFGVAKVRDAGRLTPQPLAVPTETGVIVGTPRFYSPEQCLGKPADYRSDLYSLGLVLYRLLAGRNPFDGVRGVVELARAHAFQAPEPPSHWGGAAISPELDAIVLRCLAKSPDARFSSAAEMAGALAALSAGPAPWQQAPPASEPIAKLASRTVVMADTPEPAPAALNAVAPTANWPDAGSPAAPTAQPPPVPLPAPARSPQQRFRLGTVLLVVLVAALGGAGLAAALARLL